MNNNDASIAIVSAIGGSIITSVIAPYIARISERKRYRADALAALKKVEACRYYVSPLNGESEKEFYEALAAFETSLLVAGARKDLSDYYKHIAYIAFKINAHVEEKGSKQSAIANTLTTDVAEMLVYCLWHPFLSRFKEKPDVQQYLRIEEYIKKKYKKELDGRFWSSSLLKD